MCGGRFFTFGAIIVGLSFWAVGLNADESRLRPDLPEPKGEACVEPTEVMRRRHMEFLLHHRDRAVHEGVREKKHSLVECLECHARPNERGEYARHTESEHFCTACHAFSSVQIDCFSCHADRPRAFYRNRSGAAGGRVGAAGDGRGGASGGRGQISASGGRGQVSALGDGRGGALRATAEALKALRDGAPRAPINAPMNAPMSGK